MAPLFRYLNPRREWETQMSKTLNLKGILAGTARELLGLKNSRDGRECESFSRARVFGDFIKPSSRSLAVLLSTGAMLVLAAGLVAPPNIQADNDDETTTVSVDVRQVASTNSQNNVDPSEPPPLFTRGDTFILGGDVYPSGTIQRVSAGVTAPD